MQTVGDITAALENILPLSAAFDWDNTGLALGDRNTPVHRVLVALDPFEDTAREAAELGAEMLITHHPLLFTRPLSLTSDTGVGKTARILLANGVSAWSAHTNLDMAEQGVNQILAQRLGLIDITGAPGLLRFGMLPEQPLREFLTRVKGALGTPVLRFADSGKPVNQIAVGGGACAGELKTVIAAGCDTFVTSDVKYNDFWDAQDAGVTIIDAGHFYTENPVCGYLAGLLRENFPDVETIVSRIHRDCMKFF